VTEGAPPDVLRELARDALRARALLWSGPLTQLNRITLLPHQNAAVDWLLRRLTRYGGALLADSPGLGKTYVALGIAAARAERPLVIAPAALRDRWRSAGAETGVTIEFVSTERLSAPAPLQRQSYPLVIIDEAHHLRTPDTRRHGRTLALCGAADVLLLSATPIHNRAADLEHLLALFHLPATRASVRVLGRRLTLRRTLADILTAWPRATLSMPAVTCRRSSAMRQHQDGVPEAILALPPLRDGAPDEGHTLLQLGLLHALRSSDAAARERIRRRVAITLAIEDAVSAGIAPSPAVRRAWNAHGNDVQLAMAALVGDASAGIDPALASGARRQRAALESLLPRLSSDGDDARAVVLRRLARWCDRPVVAFTWSSATARAMYQRLRHAPGISLLSGSTAQIASGSISRSELLDRLLRHAGDGGRRPRQSAIRLAIVTDVLSEGLSLAGVGTIVHLDSPWTVARIEQRNGRAARIGAPIRELRVVVLEAPLPASARDAHEALLRRKQRAMQKLEKAAAPAGDVAVLTQIPGARRPATSFRSDQRGTARWETLVSSELRSALILAAVRLQGRRTLVALDDVGLRAPKAADWLIAAHAVPSSHRRGYIARLRRALRAHAAERELRTRISSPTDARLHARQQADEMLAASARASRAKRASDVTGLRRDVMQITRRHAVAALRAAPHDAERGMHPVTGCTSPMRGTDSARRDVTILRGLTIIPHSPEPVACD
jgi:Helicase conserved C-terminal domain